jgi:hypothetical protein
MDTAPEIPGPQPASDIAPPPAPPEQGEPPQIKHRPRGKIARLPQLVREKLNLLLDDGNTYPEAIARLGEDGQNLSVVDICRWYQSGFQDWVKNQLWLEQTRSRLDLATDVIAEHTGANVHQANLHIAATQLIHDLIDRGQNLLEERPEQYVDLVNSIARLSREALNFQKYREACALARAEIAKLKNLDHPPTQEETLAVVNHLDQILGFK